MSKSDSDMSKIHWWQTFTPLVVQGEAFCFHSATLPATGQQKASHIVQQIGVIVGRN